ncbi:amino acid ABC transporter ATP-binding protein, PAAT family (TC 3.A.1.3.-) [Bifidobacterium bohemicum]|uniref:Glutamine transport ATP-binding protein glnQ n=1 Tax=Bifidobacterium bohemicum DSM 22767 TaxID=1437606 RepID=A0A086ZEP1_9BIFI|nr:amino acid ABC transporter ATP-binding protein [Bifidobacterium bohemicum]KFI44991.1 glutamine transport ATP-binding protein glnQ [Bifidobacterium bohemicum DSM 22767]SCC12805.1 amino acid ABC transporter ATP-binding protein, PAAT family (TC 3.A.1.3.-) [Bifidobacterium bohemicum]
MTDINATTTGSASLGVAGAAEHPAVTAQGAALSVRHLVKQYDNASAPVLNDISFDVPAGQVFVILGPSGSGKSTLLRTIAGLEPIQGGEITMGGELLRQAQSAGKLRSASASDSTKVGMVFQSYDLFPNKTVLGNIMLAPVLVQKRDKASVQAEALRLLERVGLADRKDAWPHELSGGQRQRVAICRALIEHPQVMLFDEVTAALDPEMVREVLDVILELANSGQTMLIVTHEMAFARAVADHVVLLANGSIVEESDHPQEFFDHPHTERAQQFLATFTYDRGQRQS